MSLSLGTQVILGDYHGARVPVMEHVWGISREAVRHFSGRDPLADAAGLSAIYRDVSSALDVDLLWGGGLPAAGDEPLDWSAGPAVRQNRSGHDVVQWGIFSAAHQEDGRHFMQVPMPKSVDEALEFRPLDYFPKTIEQYREEFCAAHLRMRESCGEVCWPLPHHYTTAFHWPLACFGFEMLCEAGMEEERFARLMERFAEISWRITSAWAQVPELGGFICHDDLAMASGPIFRPDWYRRHVFAHYPAVFAPLKRAGVTVLFTSDGDCTALVDDIFKAGADGLNFEYLVDLAWLVERYPDKLLVGNINSATIARGTREQIDREVRRCVEIGSRARRFVVNVGGGITHDMPAENLEYYVTLRRELCRTVRNGSKASLGPTRASDAALGH